MASNPEQFRYTEACRAKIVQEANSTVIGAAISWKLQGEKLMVEGKSEELKKYGEQMAKNAHLFILNDVIDKHLKPDGSLKEKAGGQQ